MNIFRPRQLLCVGMIPFLWAAAIRAEIGLKVTGNEFFRDSRIKEVIAPDPETYDQDGLNAWKDDAVFYVEDLYRQSGFFDAEVAVALKRADSSKAKDYSASIQVREGKRYRLDSVRVLVISDYTDGDTLPAISPDTGAVLGVIVKAEDLSARTHEFYQEAMLFKDKRFLTQQYGNSGFVRAQIDDKVTVKPETKTIRIDYWVTPSYPVIFDTLMISNRRAPPADSLPGLTRHSILQSLSPYEPGDTVRISQNDRWLAKLQYTGAFRYVRFSDSLLPNEEHTSAILLQMEERVPGHLKSSVFWESQYGFGVSTDAKHSNMLGTLNEVRGGAGMAVSRQSVYAGYGSPLTLGYLIRFDDDVTVDFSQDQKIHRNEGLFGGDFRAANVASLTWPWSYWLRLSTNAELESKSTMLNEAGGRERSLNLNFIQSANIAFLNQPMDPSRGMRFTFSWGNGGALVEDGTFRFAEFRHNWLEGQSAYYYYIPGTPQIATALRLDGGRFFGEGGTNTTRFFLGGGRNVRSYDYQKVCPEINEEGACISKEIEAAYFLASYELRLMPFGFGFPSSRGKWKSLTSLSLVPFIDFGKVWNLREGFEWNTEAHGQGAAYGLGFRYPLLGIFNLRVDFAYKHPDPRGWPDRFVVDLAQAF